MARPLNFELEAEVVLPVTGRSRGDFDFSIKADIGRHQGKNHLRNFFPMLWTKEGKDINSVSKKAIPVEEQYDFNMDMKKQLGDR